MEKKEMVGKNYQALILVGGLGTRLRPVTEKVPKPMVEIEGRPFLEYKIESLKKCGIKDFILCIGHLGNKVEEYFRDGKDFGVNISYSYEKENLLGTAGAIKNAEPLIKDTFIVANGDTFLDVDFKKLTEFHESHNSPITMVVNDATHPKTQELVELKDQNILKFYKRDTPEHENHLRLTNKPIVNGGSYVVDKMVLSNIPQNQKFSLEQDFFPSLLDKIKIFVHNGYMLDIADENDWLEFNKDLREGLILPGIYNRQKTIRSRAPVRITFGGGGTDIPPYDELYKGRCVSATINKYAYSTLRLRNDKKIKIKSDIINLKGEFETYEQMFDEIGEINTDGEDYLNLIKATILEMNPGHGFDLYVRSDVPPHSGLGASASLCASIIGVLNYLRKKNRLTKHEIAEAAYNVEQKRMNIISGRQDQYATVFGGINLYEFNGNDKVKVNPISIKKDIILEIEKHLLVVSSGSRIKSSGEIHQTEKRILEDKEKTKKLHDIKDVALEMEFNLRRGNLKKFGQLMLDSWEKKKKYNPEYTNEYINFLVETALSNGAIGARLMGAGGHLLIYSEPDKEHKIKKMLSKEGANSIDFSFDFDGLKIWEVEE